MRKVYVDITFRVWMNVDDGVEISKIIDELDYTILDTTAYAEIEDTELTSFEIIDSK